MYYDKNGVVRAVGAEVLQENMIETAEEEEWDKVEWSYDTPTFSLPRG